MLNENNKDYYAEWELQAIICLPKATSCLMLSERTNCTMLDENAGLSEANKER